MNNPKIGCKLIQLRRSVGKRQQEVADACHITRQALSNYELGKRIPDTEMILRLSDYYGITVDELLR